MHILLLYTGVHCEYLVFLVLAKIYYIMRGYEIYIDVDIWYTSLAHFMDVTELFESMSLSHVTLHV